QLINWIRQNQWVIPLLGYLVFAPSLCFILLWKRPLWLLQLNESLENSNVELPFLGGFKISIRTLLFIQWFHYHPRVLDAWVNKHICKARIQFAKKKAVKNHEVYIPVPIKLNDNPPTELTVEELRSSFDNNRDCLVIWGEGGSGKTNLACQIAKWAMSEDKTKRLFDYLMIPVLIEQELTSEGKGEQSPLLEAIKGQLSDITDNKDDDISDKFLNYLLRRNRILVIVDHLSEMSEATRKQICPARSKEEFPISKLIVTSRQKQNFAVTGTTIQTQKIYGEKLFSVMQTYLTEKGKALFDEAECHETCGQLCKLVGKHRNITVLLARMFAKQKIAAKEGTIEHDGDQSDNIPDLMISYLNTLNETNQVCGYEKLDDDTVRKDAKIIAWECLKSSYKAEPAKRQDVLDALGGDNPEKHLNYLEKRLNLIQITGPAKDKVRFNIELLAEYLAGLHLVDVYGNNEENWCDFFKNADTKLGAPNSIQSFLVAVRDCCQAQNGVPHFVVKELNKRAGVVATEQSLQMSVVQVEVPLSSLV
ncbi:MAG TPA: PBS lyase, partial [Cyanobacteria bacterium UBA11162]|nr:PBS lyase [Cyanobacteria bacterium UBA11162]